MSNYCVQKQVQKDSNQPLPEDNVGVLNSFKIRAEGRPCVYGSRCFLSKNESPSTSPVIFHPNKMSIYLLAVDSSGINLELLVCKGYFFCFYIFVKFHNPYVHLQYCISNYAWKQCNVLFEMVLKWKPKHQPLTVQETCPTPVTIGLMYITVYERERTHIYYMWIKDPTLDRQMASEICRQKDYKNVFWDPLLSFCPGLFLQTGVNVSF